MDGGNVKNVCSIIMFQAICFQLFFKPRMLITLVHNAIFQRAYDEYNSDVFTIVPGSHKDYNMCLTCQISYCFEA